jgi:hypothetical protein
VIYCIQIEFDEMMVVFWVFTPFSFLLCSHILEEYTTSIIGGGLNQFRWIYLEDGVSMFPWNVRTNQNTVCCRSPIDLISSGEKIWKLTDFKFNVHTQSTGNLNTVCRFYHALWSTLYLCSASRASDSLYKSSISCLFVPGTKVCMYSCV